MDYPKINDVVGYTPEGGGDTILAIVYNVTPIGTLDLAKKERTPEGIKTTPIANDVTFSPLPKAGAAHKASMNVITFIVADDKTVDLVTLSQARAEARMGELNASLAEGAVPWTIDQKNLED